MLVLLKLGLMVLILDNYFLDIMGQILSSWLLCWPCLSGELV